MPLPWRLAAKASQRLDENSLDGLILDILSLPDLQTGKFVLYGCLAACLGMQAGDPALVVSGPELEVLLLDVLRLASQWPAALCIYPFILPGCPRGIWPFWIQLFWIRLQASPT